MEVKVTVRVRVKVKVRVRVKGLNVSLARLGSTRNASNGK